MITVAEDDKCLDASKIRKVLEVFGDPRVKTTSLHVECDKIVAMVKVGNVVYPLVCSCYDCFVQAVDGLRRPPKEEPEPADRLKLVKQWIKKNTTHSFPQIIMHYGESVKSVKGYTEKDIKPEEKDKFIEFVKKNYINVTR